MLKLRPPRNLKAGGRSDMCYLLYTVFFKMVIWTAIPTLSCFKSLSFSWEHFGLH